MSTSSPQEAGGTGPLVLHFGQDELVIRQRYEVLSIINDLLIGAWFVVGSVLFLFDALAHAGTWLFILGSIEMLIRPTIRFVRRVHLRRFHPHGQGTADAAHDF